MDAVSPAFSVLAIVSILAVTGLLAVIEKRVTRGDLARIVLVAGVGAGSVTPPVSSDSASSSASARVVR